MKKHSAGSQVILFLLGFCIAFTGCALPIDGTDGIVPGIILVVVGMCLLGKKDFYSGKAVYFVYVFFGVMWVLCGLIMINEGIADNELKQLANGDNGYGAPYCGALMTVWGGMLLWRSYRYMKSGYGNPTPLSENTAQSRKKKGNPATVIQQANTQRPMVGTVDFADFDKIEAFSMNDIDAISQVTPSKRKGDLFEHYCAKLLEAYGFKNVQVVGGAGDLGADIIAWMGNRKTVIQCKCYQGTVPYHALEQTVTARKNIGAGEAIILTNSHFSNQTKALAPEHQVHLWDREKLQELIDTANEVKHGRA